MPSPLSAIISPARLKAYAIASLVSQILIVVTGGLVRLTGSGLGCPTWPKCTDDSYVTVPEMGIHGVIEFGNRLLTFVLIIIALLTFIVVRRSSQQSRFGLTWPALSLGLGIVAQALLGGLTVLTGLNPYIVGAHFVLSGILISIAAILVFRVFLPQTSNPSPIAKTLAWPIFVVGWIAVLIGVLVTGAGPHAGDSTTPRNGLDLELWQHYHSYPAYLLLALVLVALVGQWFQRSKPGSAAALRALAALWLVAVAQAAIGIAQARLGVPPLLVAAHMLGASVMLALFVFVILTLRSKFAARRIA